MASELENLLGNAIGQVPDTEAQAAPAPSENPLSQQMELEALLAPAARSTPNDSYMDYLKKLVGDTTTATMQGVGHLATLPQALTGDLSNLSHIALNKTLGTGFPVNNSYLAQLARGLVKPGVPVQTFGDVLNKQAPGTEGPKVNVPGLGQVGWKDAVGMGMDLATNPGAGLSTLSKGASKLAGKAGNRIYNNAWRFITREFQGYRGNPANNAERFLEQLKGARIGEGAHLPEDIENQYRNLVQNKSDALNRYYDAGEGTNSIDFAPGLTKADSDFVKRMVDTGSRTKQEMALDYIAPKLAPEFQPLLEDAKLALTTTDRTAAKNTLGELLDSMAMGPRTLSEVRAFKGVEGRKARQAGQYQWGTAKTATGAQAADAAEAANDILDRHLNETVSPGTSEGIHHANLELSNLLRGENPLRREAKKQMGMAHDTQIDKGLEMYSLARILMGEPKAAVEAASLLAGKKVGKNLNALASGSRYGLKALDMRDLLKNAANYLEAGPARAVGAEPSLPETLLRRALIYEGQKK